MGAKALCILSSYLRGLSVDLGYLKPAVRPKLELLSPVANTTLATNKQTNNSENCPIASECTVVPPCSDLMKNLIIYKGQKCV